MGIREDLDKFDYGEVAHSFRRDGSGDFDRDGNGVVHDSSLVLVGVSRKLISRTGQGKAVLRWRLGRRRRLIDHSLPYHLLELFDEKVFGVAGLQDVPLQHRQSWHKR